MRLAAWIAAVLLVTSCSEPPRRLTVAGASDLTKAFEEIGREFRADTGTEVVLTFGSTATLARQIASGAPFDVYAAADLSHVDELVSAGHILADTRAVYGQGQLALWAPGGGIASIQELSGPRVRVVSIAEPDAAPYGAAAMQALRSAGVLDTVQPKLVYGANVNQARQFAATGNADVALVAYSLVQGAGGVVTLVDRSLYRPLNQAMGVVTGSPRLNEARAFAKFVLSERGRAILAKNGYLPAPR